MRHSLLSFSSSSAAMRCRSSSLSARAYKKYYARTMRKDMTKAEFEAWTREAEQKRDAALEPYARAESEEERQRIAAELEEKLNRL